MLRTTLPTPTLQPCSGLANSEQAQVSTPWYNNLMQISFLEEYPTDDNLNKLKLLSFKTNLYLASESVNQFLRLKQKIKKQYENVGEIIYWPILKVSEGYWMSAFSKNNALARVIKEINSDKENFPILWDAELPLLNKRLYFTEIFNFFRNLQIIKKALSDFNENHPIIVAAFPKEGINKFLHYVAATSFYGGRFSYADMIYTSLLKDVNKKEFLKRTVKKSKNKFREYIVSLGLIAGGVEGTASLISKEDLLGELDFVEKQGIKEVVIYRLGGLNEGYLSVIKKFA